MPANLTPDYEKAEQRYREAVTDSDKLAALEEMLRVIPKHKGTEKMQADLKRRLSQLRKLQSKEKQSKGPDPFHVPKTGAGQVILIGPPNTGKSSLLAATTNAEVKVAEYPFTTVTPQPGVWFKDDIQIQLVDTPPLSLELVPTGLMGTIRSADVICPMADASANDLEQVDTCLEALNERGLSLSSQPRNQMSAADPHWRSGLIILNKIDLAADAEAATLRELYADRLEVLPISTHSGQGLNELFQRLWVLLAVIRVYSKQPGKPPDLHQPFILAKGATVADLARKIHRDLPETMKHARIWGAGHYEGQHVHRTEILQDQDIVEIHE